MDYKRNKLVKTIFQNSKWILISLLALVIILLLKRRLSSIFLVIILIFLASVSIYWKRFTRLSLGIELNSFVTIILSSTYTTIFGLVIGVITVFIGYLLNRRVCMYMFIPMIGVSLIAFLSPLFSPLGITTAGIVLNLIYNGIIHFIYVVLLKNNFLNSILSFSINFLLNIYLFYYIAPQLVNIL
ncbi:hypothetical protein JW930_06185 [Candidatus Woesearchaeota archaeon]|nr:hypothetical protein [Candidatus Woesearchaeota archaeon]